MTEASIVKAIQRYVKDNGGKCYKLHGGRFGQAGAPDLIGCVHGSPFVAEVKRPSADGGGDPTPKQTLELFEWGKQGFIRGVVRSLDDFKLLTNPRVLDDSATPTPAHIGYRIRTLQRREAMKHD